MMETAQDVTSTTGQTQKLVVERFAADTITLLSLAGTIDEQFDGKKLAASLKGRILVLDLGEVRKISSFGVREWVDFVRAAGERFESVILVECSPKVVDQLNMVMNFAGSGPTAAKVFSFYAPYRCDYCDADRRILLQVDRDFDAIRGMKPPERPCPSCGNSEYFDEDPPSYLSYLAQQPRFELEAPVAAFLATRLNYSVEGGARRFRVEKLVEGRGTYLRLSGDLDGNFPRDKVADGLEGQVVVDVRAVGKIDPAGAAGWRAFLAQVSMVCEHVVLVSCPPAFLERLSRAEDLGKAQVLSFTMPYACAACGATTAQLIDVEEHFDIIKFATPPDMTCPDCGGKTTCSASETLLAHLGALSRPAIPDDLRQFIVTARERREQPVAAVPVIGATAPTGSRTTFVTLMVAAAAAAVVAVLVVLALGWLRREEHAAVAAGGLGSPVERSAAARPAWVTSDTPGFSACRDSSGTLVCLGASTVTAGREPATHEAADAALEALVNRIGVAEALSGEAALYGPARQRALAALAGARERSDTDSAASIVRSRRQAVADALRATGGAAVPAQTARTYWESYAGGRVVAWSEVEIAKDALAALEQRYTLESEALGGHAITLFPALAWRWPSLNGSANGGGALAGAYLVRVDEGPLRAIGLSPQDVVLELQGRPVTDAPGFASALNAEAHLIQQDGGAVKMVVKSGDGEPRAFNLNVARAVVTQPPTPGDHATPRPGNANGNGNPSGGGVNVWDKTGGGTVRDNPNQ